MNLPAVDTWSEVGENDSARYFTPENGIIVVIPHDNCVDTAQTARAAIALQVDHWKRAGHAGASIVLMDQISHQEAGARRVYQHEIDADWYTCVALVTNSVFGRAVASIFLGLAKPPVPTRMFADLEAALVWARHHNTARSVTNDE